ncbi:hypothetical protein CDAR_224921 [Caerostris darwini]|uniref:Uncharacterized protein n=1 Tax=Caerostris darwini TaxID=1538125 RepID=A0AAV4N9Q2_9ARAC|nr:hypothetical protein CDAR_224921 [Caerostris darwini]
MIEFTSKMTIRLFRDLGGGGGRERNGTLKGAINSDSGILPPPLSRIAPISRASHRRLTGAFDTELQLPFRQTRLPCKWEHLKLGPLPRNYLRIAESFSCLVAAPVYFCHSRGGRVSASPDDSRITSRPCQPLLTYGYETFLTSSNFFSPSPQELKEDFIKSEASKFALIS